MEVYVMNIVIPSTEFESIISLYDSFLAPKHAKSIMSKNIELLEKINNVECKSDSEQYASEISKYTHQLEYQNQMLAGNLNDQLVTLYNQLKTFKIDKKNIFIYIEIWEISHLNFQLLLL